MCTYSFPVPCIISERAFLYCHWTRISFWLEVTVPAYLCMNSTVLTWKTQDFLLDPFAMICIQLITLLLVLQLHINSMCIDQLYWTHSRNGSQAFYCTCSSGSNYTFFCLCSAKQNPNPGSITLIIWQNSYLIFLFVSTLYLLLPLTHPYLYFHSPGITSL